ncbi:MAG: oligosaccharide flippase family protein [Microbacteriaceae bacterium]|nr:oligosaccharide flippase family protein [Microbacteriaceae bacterium]
MTIRIGNLVVGIVLARIIAPEAFGVFAIALTVWSVLGSVAEFGLGADLVRRDDYEAHIPTVATIGAVVSGSLAALMFLASSSIAAAFGNPAATTVVQLMAIPMFLIGLSVVPAALLQRQIRQGTLFAIDGSSLVISTVVTIVLALIGLGPAALAVGRIAGQVLAIILQYLAVHRWPVFGWSSAVARQAIAFGAPLAFANVVSWSIISFDNLIVARMMGAVELGLYVLAFNIASWPMSVAGQSVRVIALPAFSRLTTNDHRGRAMVKASGLIWSVSGLAALGLAFVAPQVVSVLYGERWIGAAAAIAPLALFGAFRVVFDLAATYLIACGMTRSVLMVQLIWLAALVPAMILGVQADGLAGAGWAHVLVAVVVVLPVYLFYLRRARVPVISFLRGWIRPTVMAIPLAFGLWLISSLVVPPILALVLAATAGILLYALPMSKWWVTRAKSLGVRESLLEFGVEGP